MSNEPHDMTIEGMKEIIMKSGYLLEIDVAEALRKDEWLVFSQYPYVDRKEGKTRFVDIRAMKHVFPKFSFSLLIQCKKASHHGWAFSTIGKTPIGKMPRIEVQAPMARLSHLSMQLRGIVTFENLSEVLKNVESLTRFHPMNPQTRIGTSCCIPPNHHDDFHEAMLQVLNSLRWIESPFPGTSHIVFPVIVFDGPMWEFHKEESELKIGNIEYLQYLTAMFGMSDQENENQFLIDVVRFPFFEGFLRIVNGSIQWLKEFAKVEEK